MICVTRIHCKSANSLTNINKVILFINNNSYLYQKILICLGIGDNLEYLSYYEELLQTIQNENLSENVIIQPVCPWGSFTNALNIAIKIATDLQYEKILFQSLEVTLNQNEKDTLISYFDSNTLVVGPVLPGHLFNDGINKLTGRTCPWNTCAIWDLNKLRLFGFPLIGDGVGKDIPGGVEEVSAIAFAQLINTNWEAKLIKLNNSIDWETEFQDEERKKWHEQKMASKDTRPAAQMAVLGNSIPEGRVHHIISSS